jgi:hypothetical protein
MSGDAADTAKEMGGAFCHNGKLRLDDVVRRIVHAKRA